MRRAFNKANEPYEVPFSWRAKVIDRAVEVIQSHPQGGGVMSTSTKRLVVRRIDRLIGGIQFFLRENQVNDPKKTGPFDPDDAVAMVLMKRSRALKIARSLFGARVADLLINPDGVAGSINMDWLDYKLV